MRPHQGIYLKYRKKTLEKRQLGLIIGNPITYRIDSEVGRFQFITQSCLVNEEEFNTAKDLFPVFHSKGSYKTSGFKGIALIYGNIKESYRKTTDLIKRVRYQWQGGKPYRTLQDTTEKEGSDLIDFIGENATHILQDNGFNETVCIYLTYYK